MVAAGLPARAPRQADPPGRPAGFGLHPRYTPSVDPEEIAGGPRLDRQERAVRLGADGRPLVPQRVPETRPTPLQDAFIHLSIVVLVCGVIAIMALELGTPMSSLWVRLPVAVGGAVLLLVTGDAIVRIWRSAFAWLPVDRGRGLFRFLWVAVLSGSLFLTACAMWIVLRA